MLEEIKSLFGGGHSEEFNEGLLAGYAGAYQLLSSGGKEGREFIGAVIAYLSEVLEERS